MPTYTITAPNGKTYSIDGPEGATREQVMQKVLQRDPTARGQDNRPTSWTHGFGDSWNKALGNYGFLSQFNPFTPNAGGNVQSRATDAARQRYNATAKTRPSGWGQFFGGLAATAPTTVLGPVTGGGLSGLLLSDNVRDPKTAAVDAAFGAAGGKAGQIIGEHVIAPVAKPVVNAAANYLVRPTVNAVRRAVGVAPRPPMPRLNVPEQAVVKMAPELDQALADTQDAVKYNLPYALADTSPKMQALAGSVARKSLDARQMGQRALRARNLAQAPRAVEAIDKHLAPITDIEQRAADIMQGGASEYAPLYEKAYQVPPITSPELQRVLNTPAAKQAISRANTIAANEYRDPKALGFVLDKDGNVALNPISAITESPTGSLAVTQEAMRQPGYTTQSLDYVKRGLDDILEQYRDPITGKLKLDEAGRAINGVKNDLLREMDRVNPEYAAARQSYQKFAGQRDALTTGNKVLSSGALPDRNFNRISGRIDEANLPEVQRGYATAMADQANRMRLTGSNPYNALYNTTDQQARIKALFPNGAKDFGRIADLETQMADTYHTAFGGSQTQANAMADQLYGKGVVGNTLDAAANIYTHGGYGAAKAVARTAFDKLADSTARDEATAKAIAPVIFNTDPRATMGVLNQIIAKRAAIKAQEEANAKALGQLGIVPGALAATSLPPLLGF